MTPPARSDHDEVEAMYDIDGLSEKEWRAAVRRRFDTGNDRMNEMAAEIKDNTVVTEETKLLVAESLLVTRQISAYLEAGKTTAKVFGFVGRMARYWGVLATGAVTLYVALQALVTHIAHGPKP